MDIANLEPKQGVQIQIKALNKNSKSRSFTIHDTNVNEVFNRIFFLFEQLSKSEGNITIIHYKTKEEKENGEQGTE